MPEAINELVARILQASELEIFAVVSGLLQALGYGFYIWKSLKHETKPNPATWLMFAYGTAILTYLEFDLEVNPILLVLPIVCASLSIVVVIFIFWNFKLQDMEWKPENRIAYLAVGIDVMLTVAYVTVKLLSETGTIPEHEKHMLVLAFLALSNASTLVSFMPLVRDTLIDPKNEHPLPWFVWGSAYATLAAVTFFESGFNSEFMVYPAMNTVLHLSVGLLASRRWIRLTRPLAR